ncbi:MAG TPA: DNA sulfur modification protein DndE [Abditibacterium sp.]|jgi:DNA sulfur modification protein DndE
MKLNRIVVSSEVDLRLRNLKSNTGLTPNLSCRLGFVLSLAEPGVPDPSLYGEGTGREFNRYTLTGPWDDLFFALLRERMVSDGFDLEKDLEAQFKAHLARGVVLLYQRLKSVDNLGTLLEEAQKKAVLRVNTLA